MIKRKQTRKIKVGNIYVGGDSPVIVQSMANTKTTNIAATVKQINSLEKAGCELARIAIPDMAAAKCIAKIKSKINIPLVADIHFSADLAIESIKQGIDKLRINPGNINPKEKIPEIVRLCKEKHIPIRIGINAGSLEPRILKASGGKATAKGMVQSAMNHIKILEKLNFKDIIISVKASDIARSVAAYQMLSRKTNYPLHLGITEAGTKFRGTVLSSIGIGILLQQGIGDTIRVSLTDDPIEELPVAWEILSALNIRKHGPRITSCPTCGRTEIDLVKLTQDVELLTKNIKTPLHIAVMGCVVNGPGEAREADLAVIGGKKVGLICRKGKIISRVNESQLLSEFKKILEKEIKNDTNNGR